MVDFSFYAIVAIALALVAGVWYMTKDTPYGKMVIKYGIILVVFIVLLVASKNGTIFTSIANWFRNRSDDKKIKDLDKKIDNFEKRKKDGLIKAGEIGKEAEALREEANVIRKEVEDLDKVIDTTEGHLEDDNPSKLPKHIKDPVKDAKNLLKALRERRAGGQ